MRRYWVIAPYHADLPEEWARVWRHDLEHGIISIGWRNLGDVSSLDEDRLWRLIRRKYPDHPDGEVTRIANMLHHFYHSVSCGDVVIARQGTKKIAAVGTVRSPAFYDP